MSKAVIPLNVVAIEDPTTRLGRPTAIGVAQGGVVYSYQPINASSAGPTNITFTAPPPSPDIIVDRRVYLAITYDLQFTGTSTGGPLLNLGVTDGPRCFPNMQCINTLSAVINNNTVSRVPDALFSRLL